jgi:hypothetical protein
MTEDEMRRTTAAFPRRPTPLRVAEVRRLLFSLHSLIANDKDDSIEGKMIRDQIETLLPFLTPAEKEEVREFSVELYRKLDA